MNCSSATRSIGSLALALAALAAPVGCAMYANYPPIGKDVAVNDPNVAPIPTVTRLSLQEVLNRYPIEGQFVVNLPAGMERDRASGIVAGLGDGANLVTPETSDLPALHVSLVWVRGDRATVEIIRPVMGILTVTGEEIEPSNQAITVRLRRSGFGAWHVSSMRAWTVGAADPPELYGWPEDSGTSG